MLSENRIERRTETKATDRPVIWRIPELIKATGGRLVNPVQPDLGAGYSSLTFPLGFLQSDTVLLHVYGPDWRDRTIRDCGQRDLTIDALLEKARQFENILVVSTQEPENEPPFPVLLVDSSYKALFRLAVFQRRRFHGRVIGITGTSGKSSTRDMVAALLGKKGLTSATRGNWNTTEGIALSMANIVPEAEYAVLEISGGAIKGMRGVSALDMVHHHDAIITSIGVNLTSRTPTARDVAEVKSLLFSHLSPGGRAYYTHDVAERDILEKAAAGFAKRIIGDDRASTIRMRQLQTELDGSLLQLHLDGKDVRVKANVIGPGQLNNLSLAVQLAVDLGVQAEDIVQTIGEFSLATRKMEVSTIKVGATSVKFLDDCHNATLVSFTNALGHIEKIRATYDHCIFIVGRIVHIEGIEENVYGELGERIAACGPAVVILFDEGLALLKSRLDELRVPILEAASPQQVIDLLAGLVRENSVVFLKGSHRGTQIRRLSALLRQGGDGEPGRRCAGILYSRFTQYELAYFIEALTFYDEVLYIDPALVTYRLEPGSAKVKIDYLGRSLEHLSMLYTFEYGERATLLARVLRRGGCEISDSFDEPDLDDPTLFGVSPGIDAAGIGATRHILGSLPAAEAYLRQLDAGAFPLCYNPPGRRSGSATMTLTDAEQAIRWCDRYFSGTSALLCLEGPLQPVKSWRVVAVDGESVACCERRIDRENQGEEYLKVEAAVEVELTRTVAELLPGRFRKGVYGVDVVNLENGTFRITGIRRRPAFGALRNLYSQNYPALVHDRISRRALPRESGIDEEETAFVLFLGDTNPGETYQLRGEEQGKDNILKSRGYDHAFRPFKPLLESADYRVMNFEAVITGERESPFREIKPYLDWASPDAAPALLRDLGIDAVSLANNHSLDFGAPGLEEMQRLLDEYGIAHFGAAADANAAARPLHHLLQVGERKLRLIITTGFEHRGNHEEWGYYARSDRAGVNDWSAAEAADQIACQRAEFPDAFIVAFPHWGSNYSYKAERQERMARAMIDAGADLIIGHGSHMMQEIEQYRDRWILYGIGNFVYNAPGRFHRFDVLPYGLIAGLRFLGRAERCDVRLELYPVFSDNRKSGYAPRYLNGGELKELVRRFMMEGGNGTGLICRAALCRNRFGPHVALPVVCLPWA